MAYACPVCQTLAPDGEHLAHHLAIVAMTRGGEHEDWLDEHAEAAAGEQSEDWREASPDDLAALATEHADEVEHDLVDDSAGAHPDVGHAHQDGHEHGGHADGHSRASGADSDEAAAVLAEAREMTEEMLDAPEGGAVGEEAPDDDGADGDAPGTEAAETDSDE